MVKNLPASPVQETMVRSLGQKDPLEEGLATHSSILAWRIPWTEGAWWAPVHKILKSQGTTEVPEHKFKEGREFGAQKPLVKNGTS